MLTTSQCDCGVAYSTERQEHIVYCSMHEAAPELVAVLVSPRMELQAAHSDWQAISSLHKHQPQIDALAKALGHE